MQHKSICKLLFLHLTADDTNADQVIELKFCETEIAW